MMLLGGVKLPLGGGFGWGCGGWGVRGVVGVIRDRYFRFGFGQWGFYF